LRPWWREESRRRVLQRRSIGRTGGLATHRAGHSKARRRAPQDALYSPGRWSSDGTEYFVVPGGPIPRDVGDELVTMPDIRPLDCGMFHGVDGQTWELVR
jgi:hypothetical protein